MEFTSIVPSILIEEDILNGDLVCSCTLDSEASFEIASSTMDYFSIDSTNGNVYLTATGLAAINQDYPEEPYREITSLSFEYVATQLQTGLQAYQAVTISVVRVHDSEPLVTNVFVEPTYTDNLTDTLRVFEVRTAYPAIFTVIGDHYNNMTVPDPDVGRITLTSEGNTYLQNLDWTAPDLEMIGSYKIQRIIVQVNIEDRENNKTIQHDLELVVYLGAKDNLLPTKNNAELLGESLGDFVGRLAGRLDITNKEFLMELETIKMNTTVLLDKTFHNEAMTSEIEMNIDNLIERLKASDAYRDTRFQTLIQSFKSDFIETIFGTLKTYQTQNNNVLEIMEVGGLTNTNIQDSGSAKAMAFGALDYARYYADYNKVWGQHYTDRKVNLTQGDIDFKINEARDRINTTILNTYNSYFIELAAELNVNVGVIKENFDAIRKLDYRSSESERWIGNHEARLRTQEGLDLSDWDMAANSWRFASTTLDFNGLWRFHVNTSDNTYVKGSTMVYLTANDTNVTWNGSRLSVNGGAAGSNVQAEIFYGKATSANYADLAEYYRADQDYEIGTLLSIETDEDAEHEVCLYDETKPYAGVVSNNPGFILNADEDNQENREGQYWVKVALTGRVEIRCTRIQGETGEISRGLYLYPDEVNTGMVFASRTKLPNLEVIGITIAGKDLDSNLVLAKVN